VKLDVEGFEAEVLRGFGDLLSGSALRSVVFEAPGDATNQPQRYPVFALLDEAGFSIAPLAPAHPSEKSVATNFVATKR
jgi:hypothetical protein